MYLDKFSRFLGLKRFKFDDLYQNNDGLQNFTHKYTIPIDLSLRCSQRIIERAPLKMECMYEKGLFLDRVKYMRDNSCAHVTCDVSRGRGRGPVSQAGLTPHFNDSPVTPT